MISRKKLIVLGASLVLIGTGAATTIAQQPVIYQGMKEELPKKVDEQPVPFSHKQHLAGGLDCIDCHETVQKSVRAGLPGFDKCFSCHDSSSGESPSLQKLVDLSKSGRKLSWVRVYRVKDFVFFNHANHFKAGVNCKSCHGPVAQRDVLAKEVSTSMNQCMNCHNAKKVSNDCYMCHDLGQ